MTQEKFLEWASSNIPYCDELTASELTELRGLYEKVEELKEIETRILHMSFNHDKAGIDYSVDFEKASSRRVDAQKALMECRRELDEVHGYAVDDNVMISRGK